jgi:hypothetical protein
VGPLLCLGARGRVPGTHDAPVPDALVANPRKRLRRAIARWTRSPVGDPLGGGQRPAQLLPKGGLDQPPSNEHRTPVRSTDPGHPLTRSCRRSATSCALAPGFPNAEQDALTRGSIDRESRASTASRLAVPTSASRSGSQGRAPPNRFWSSKVQVQFRTPSHATRRLADTLGNRGRNGDAPTSRQGSRPVDGGAMPPDVSWALPLRWATPTGLGALRRRPKCRGPQGPAYHRRLRSPRRRRQWASSQRPSPEGCGRSA